MARKSKQSKRKVKRNIPEGIVHIYSTFNNTHITVSDLAGNVIAWSSAGACNFRGSKKSTPFAATITTENALRKTTDTGLRRVHVKVKGTGSGREAAIRAVNAFGLEVMTIKDVTPIPHNGCRPKKRRRV
jgi:small subunit ribosomal protein S11